MKLNRKAGGLSIAVVVVAAVALYLRHRASIHAEEQVQRAPNLSYRARPQQASSFPPLPSKNPNPTDPNLPIIDEVGIDKMEVCQGEQNFINVKAHTANDTNGFLVTHFMDPGTRGLVFGGARIPFRLNEPLERPMTIVVEGNMSSKTVELPPVHVKDCVAPRQVMVRIQRSAAAHDRVDLAAELIEHPATGAGETFEPMVPSSYEWDFGDGEKLTTTTAHVEHSYEGREQNVRQSSFVVAVTIKDLNGRMAQGSSIATFPNGAFAALLFENRVVISIGVKESDPTSSQHEKIWLYHGYKESVRIDRVRLIERVRAAGGELRETLNQSYDPQELLGLTELPPKNSMVIHDLTSLQPVEPEAVRYVELTGRSADGKEASGSFTLLPVRPNVKGADVSPPPP